MCHAGYLFRVIRGQLKKGRYKKFDLDELIKVKMCINIKKFVWICVV
jgi:hypothetical protein